MLPAHYNTPIRILVVEDHIALAENLFDYLSDSFYELDHAPDGFTALHLLATQRYDVIVLDVMLPGVDGFTLCHRLRHDLQIPTPVLLLTARDSLEDKTRGFEAGADDYLVKPFAMKELELRIRALYRRTQKTPSVLSIGPLRFDPGQRRIWVNDTILNLAPAPTRILEILMNAHPNLVSQDALTSSLNDTEPVDVHTLRTHIYTLRKTLQQYCPHELIRTRHGQGYYLEDPAAATP